MQQIEIHVKGHINQQWSEWFDGLTISHSDLDETVLTGVVPDQAALYGIISRLRDLGLKLISLSSEETHENHHERAKKEDLGGEGW
jgi:predicted mannosyl-3-phosphoglycerate phosphatase (HAD superfamily)